MDQSRDTPSPRLRGEVIGCDQTSLRAALVKPKIAPDRRASGDVGFAAQEEVCHGNADRMAYAR
jgi:hypothetical protein